MKTTEEVWWTRIDAEAEQAFQEIKQRRLRQQQRCIRRRRVIRCLRRTLPFYLAAGFLAMALGKLLVTLVH